MIQLDDLAEGERYHVLWSAGHGLRACRETLEFIGLAGRGRGVLDVIWRVPCRLGGDEGIVTEIPARSIRRIERAA